MSAVQEPAARTRPHATSAAFLSRSRAAAAFALLVATLTLAGTGTVVKASSADLYGEVLSSLDDPQFAISQGPSDPAGCDPAGTSTMAFNAVGPVTGPFPGTMHASGVITLGPQDFTVNPNTGPVPNDPMYGFPARYGLVQSVVGTFTVTDAGATVVGGTFDGVAAPLGSVGTNIGSCYGVGAGDHFGYSAISSGTLTAVDANVEYHATVAGQTVVGKLLIRQRQTCVAGQGCGYTGPAYNFYTHSSTAPVVSYVERQGTSLVLDGQPFRFTGMNIYNANSIDGCNPQPAPYLADALGAMDDPVVIRSWFFQPNATRGGARDWSAIDNTLAVARQHGVKVIATLGNQWPDCDGPAGGPGVYKTDQWYRSGYTTDVAAGGLVPYRAWVAEAVARYRDDPTIMAWELVNEPETHSKAPSQRAPGEDACPADAGQVLLDFTADMSGLVKSIDGHHLVSVGTIGGGQCGTRGDDYRAVHAIPTVDLCSVHDYDQPTQVIPGDQWNGMALRLRQCDSVGKAFIVGEAGLTLAQSSTATNRARQLDSKMTTAFRAGADGYVLWGWQAPPHDVGPGDPAIDLLRRPMTSWPDDGGDSDVDGISQAVDAGAGFDDGHRTVGSIDPGQGRLVEVLDADDPSRGIQIHVASAGAPSQPVQLHLCGQPVIAMTGTSADLTCGSVIADVRTGTVIVPMGDGSNVTIPAGASAEAAQGADGSFTVSNVTGTGVVVSTGDTVTPIAPGLEPVVFNTWQFSGFQQPVSNTTVNKAKAGQAIPLKFTLTTAEGSPVSTLTTATLRLSNCPGMPRTTNPPPAVYTIANGLTYQGAGRYSIVWNTSKSLARSCKTMTLDLGSHTTPHVEFSFT